MKRMPNPSPKIRFALKAGALLGLLSICSLGTVQAGNGSWTNDSGGNWSDTANWDPAVVPGTVAGDIISITNNIQDTNVTHTISVDTTVTLGTLNLGDGDAQTNISWTITGGPLTFDNTGNGAKMNMISSSAGNTISAPISLSDNLTISNASANTLSLNGIVSGNGGITVNSSGAGTFSFVYLNANNTFLGPVNLAAGNVRVGTASSTGAGGVITAGALGAGNDITLHDGVGIWGSNTDIAATNLFVLGDVNIGVATNLGTRLRFAGNLNLNGGTRIFRLSRPGTGLSACTWGSVSRAGLLQVVTNGTISFQAHPDLISGGLKAWVDLNANTYFTNNSGMIIGANVVVGATPDQVFGSVADAYPNVTIEAGGVMEMANGVNSRSRRIASLSGAGTVVNNDTDGVSGSGAGLATLTIDGSGVNAVNNAEFSGALVDGALGRVGLTKQGPTTQILSGANTYSGPTTVSSGKLITSTLSSNGAFTVTSSATLGVRVAAAGTSLQMTNLTQAASALEIDLGPLGNPTVPVIVNSGSNAVNGTVTLNLLGSASALTPGSFTILTSGSRGGVGSYVLGTTPPGVDASINDSGTSVTLTINSITPFLVWSGLAGANWDISVAGNTNWLDGVTPVVYTDNPAYGAAFDDSAAGETNVNVAATVSPQSVLINNATLQYSLSGSGKISGSASLTKQGTGTATVATANDYSGNTVVAAGTLKLGGSNVIPDGAGKADVTVNGTLNLAGFNETINGLSGSGSIQTTSGASVLTVGANDASSGFNGSLAESGGTLSLTKVGAGTVSLAAGGSHSGGTLVSGGTLETGASLGSANVTNNSVLSLNGNFTFANQVSGSGQVVKNGGQDSVVTLAGNNTYTGGTIVSSNSGTLLIDHASALGSGSSVTVGHDSALRLSGDITVSGKTLNLAGSNGRGSLASATGSSNVWAGNITLSEVGARFNSRNTVELGTLKVAGVIDSGTNYSTINVRYGTVYFANANTYLGDTIFAAGTGVLEGGNNRLPVTTTVNMGFGASVVGQLDLNGNNQELAGLQLFDGTNGSPSSSVFNYAGSVSTLTINAGTNATSYGGQIDGNIALVKAGTNSFALAGNNSYYGNTTVDAGTLFVNSAIGSPTVNVNSGGSLGGVGSLGGTVNVNSGGTLAPGTNGIGTLSLAAGLVLAGTSQTVVDINSDDGSSDLVSGPTSVSYNGTLVVNNLGAAAVTNGQIFTLFSAGGFSGNFSGISPASPAAGLAWSFDPTNGVLSAITGSTAPTPTNIVVTPLGGGQYQLSWPAGLGWVLQSQTNSRSVGLSNNWIDVTSTPPYTNSVNPANGAVFFRLKY